MTYGGHRGRSRTEIEHDVLGAMFLVDPFRDRARPRLHLSSFSTSEHRVLFGGLQIHRGPMPDPASFVARTLGIPYPDAEAWLLNSLPTTIDGDLELLLSGEL